MVGFSEIDQLQFQFFVCHYVGGLEIQVGYVVIPQVPNALGNQDAEEYLGVEGVR